MSSPGGIQGQAPKQEYFVIGKNRIKITEHFSPTGKQLDELVTDLIVHKMKEKARKSA